MKILFRRHTDYDPSEVNDPAPPRGIDRKTIVLLATGVGVMVAVLFLANQNGSDEANSASPPGLYPDVEYGGVFELGTPTPIAEPPAPAELPEWYGGRSRLSTGEEEDPRITSFQKAIGSGGLLLTRDRNSDKVTEADADVMQRTAHGPRVLLEGSMIPAVLEAPINSDRPGPVRARVTQDVTDSQSMTQTLIPVGTRVLGAMGEFETGAVSVSWHRLIFPDGSTMNIGEMPSMDRGGGGLVGNVDRHAFASFGRGALMAVLGAVSTVGTAQLGEHGGLYGGALAQQLGSGGTRTMQQFRRPPTITVPQGHSFQIWVTQDIQF
ncbi:MAG: TrbI/VirB10 family protein [Rhodothermaceae bacterium]|nr:TrbI/VirB10 family protein [Rhodothermaceae bacterium]MXX58977.1 TrbI/VirB10 family protein [Rhodothermaceae bacterium]MYD20371.1 TrbI/VirB10 family protein [Rhodothermaceae bacterium]MYD55787.1 TrbI/VirB10 family protein [Rhodothermaceae bacterium]MYI43992.1 TrbI/VirB10 family protein [Rhodothermaceae bacterium]